MKLNIEIVIVSLALALVSMNASAADAQSVRFRLDNAPSPSGSVTNTETPNDICVLAKHLNYNGGLTWHTIGCRPLNTVSSSHDFCLQGEDHDNVYQVKITISGDNAFWLDKWTAYYYGSGDCTGPQSTDNVYGVDNNVGYCLSTQSSDYSASVCTVWGTAGHVGSGPSYSEIWWDYIM